MSESFDVKTLTIPLSLTGATEIPLFQVYSGGGGITILQAHVLVSSGTSVGGKLITMTNAATPVLNGTIGAFAGTVTASATVPGACTLSSAFVADGYWVGFDQASGTVATAHLTINYVLGK